MPDSPLYFIAPEKEGFKSFFGIYYTGEKYDEYHPRQSGPQEEIPK